MGPKKISQLSVATSPLARLAPIPTVQAGVTVRTNAADVSGLYIVKIAIPSAAVLTIGSTPILAIAAPGVGYAVRIVSTTARNNFNTTAYIGSNLEAKTQTATRPQFTFAYILGSSLANIEVGVLQDFTSTASTQIIENKGIYITTFSGADPTLGDSDIDVYLTYEIIAL